MSFRLKRIIIFTPIIIAAAVAALLVYFRSDLVRLQQVTGLFDAENIIENHQNMIRIFDYQTAVNGDYTWQFREDEGTLPETFAFGDESVNVEKFLEEVNTLGMVVVHDGAIVHESYYHGSTEKTPHISWSVAKSFTSALFGIAIEEGHIDSIEDPVTKYVPILKNSGYNNVRIKDVLQMSSGVRFNEDYGDENSDINRMGRMLALDGSIDDFVVSLKNEREPGTLNHYVSMDTQVLGMILREATGRDVTSYFEEKLWRPMGAETHAHWLVDKNKMELVFGCLNAVLRDYARMGMLYLNMGRSGLDQIVPEQWVKDSITPDGEHVQPGRDVTDVDGMGYGFQWWIPAQSDGDYLAIGIYNQFIYVNPKLKVVIAKNSANPTYVEDDYISEPMHIEMFRAIAEHVAGEQDADDEGEE